MVAFGTCDRFLPAVNSMETAGGGFVLKVLYGLDKGDRRLRFNDEKTFDWFDQNPVLTCAARLFSDQ